MSKTLATLLAAAAIAASAGSAQAAFTITYGATVNVSCVGSTCTATAPNAVLGIKKIERLLARRNLTIVAGSQANDIIVGAPFNWAGSHALTLDARHSIRIDRTVDVAGPGSLTLTTNDGLQGGTLTFGASGNVHFWSTANSLTINGAAYTLVDTIAALASAVTAAPSGRYALSGAYDATPDGVYSAPPVATNFTGTFDGLGNTISHLRIQTTGGSGLFAWIDAGGAVENLVLRDVAVKGGNTAVIGALAGLNFGRIENVSSRGIVSGGHNSQIGGLVGDSGNGSLILLSSSAGTVRGSHGTLVGGVAGYISGGALNTVANSHSTATVIAGNDSHAGGLVGAISGLVTKSWASGAVSVRDQVQGGPVASAGGLVGYFIGFSGDNSMISNCYASGPVLAGSGAAAGGLIGVHFVNTTSSEPIVASYSFGTVSAGAGGYAGGLIGYRYDKITTLNTYWDTTQSGIADPSKGVGNRTNEPGITGLTTTQLKSGLPAGFSAAVWAENPHFLNGLPFLIANLPD